jgi:hypothetical protein
MNVTGGYTDPQGNQWIRKGERDGEVAGHYIWSEKLQTWIRFDDDLDIDLVCPDDGRRYPTEVLGGCTIVNGYTTIRNLLSEVSGDQFHQAVRLITQGHEVCLFDKRIIAVTEKVE